MEETLNNLGYLFTIGGTVTETTALRAVELLRRARTELATLRSETAALKLRLDTIAEESWRKGYDQAREEESAARDALAEALHGCIDSLEYVQANMPGFVGFAVRAERIYKARTALAQSRGEGGT